ncbi:Tautomerase/MIF [Armillaria mellea]|nr:Tautomerase/MIF [Armillaria mellea]
MPTLEIKTNAPIADVNAFASQFSQEAARILEKPEAVFSILGHPGSHYVVSRELLILHSACLCKELFAFVEKSLGIKNNRGYITFLDPGRPNLGLHSTTFASMFGDN